jgi:IMP cyclohydrolase
MYVGRIVAVGMSGGQSWVGYRVSSRSFPNRKSSVKGGDVAISPVDPLDLAKNPYIAYNCIRTLGNVAVVANGTQADTVVEKIGDGMKPLDAIGQTLLAYGYERDELNTPRLAGAVVGSEGFIGSVQKDEIKVKRFDLKDGEAYVVATYAQTDIERADISALGAEAVAIAMFKLPFERPVCSAAACQSEDGFELAAYNPE